MKVGVVSFCNDGYPREELGHRLEECIRRLPEGYTVENAGLVWNAETGNRKLRALDDAQVVVVPCLAACGSVYAIDYLRRHFAKPILLWHVEGQKEEGRRFVTGASGAGFTSLRYPLAKLGAEHLNVHCGNDDRSLEAYFKAAAAYYALKEAKIGMAGYADLGFYTGTFDHISFKRIFGTEIEHISLLEIATDMETPDKKYVGAFMDEAAQWINPQQVGKEELENAAKLYVALMKQVKRRGLNALSLKCFEGITASVGFTPCMPLSLLGMNLSVGCKCDMHATLSMLVLQYLSGVPAAFLELYDQTDGRILFANCGMTPNHHVDGMRSIGRFGWGGVNGIIDTSKRKQGKATLLRIDKDEENHYIAHAVCANVLKPGAWKELGWDDPAPEFPSLEVETDAKQFLEKAPGQHYALAYGDYMQEIQIFLKLLNINFI